MLLLVFSYIKPVYAMDPTDIESFYYWESNTSINNPFFANQIISTEEPIFPPDNECFVTSQQKPVNKILSLETPRNVILGEFYETLYKELYSQPIQSSPSNSPCLYLDIVPGTPRNIRFLKNSSSNRQPQGFANSNNGPHNFLNQTPPIIQPQPTYQTEQYQYSQEPIQMNINSLNPYYAERVVTTPDNFNYSPQQTTDYSPMDSDTFLQYSPVEYSKSPQATVIKHLPINFYHFKCISDLLAKNNKSRMFPYLSCYPKPIGEKTFLINIEQYKEKFNAVLQANIELAHQKNIPIDVIKQHMKEANIQLENGIFFIEEEKNSYLPRTYSSHHSPQLSPQSFHIKYGIPFKLYTLKNLSYFDLEPMPPRHEEPPYFFLYPRLEEVTLLSDDLKKYENILNDICCKNITIAQDNGLSSDYIRKHHSQIQLFLRDEKLDILAKSGKLLISDDIRNTLQKKEPHSGYNLRSNRSQSTPMPQHSTNLTTHSANPVPRSQAMRPSFTATYSRSAHSTPLPRKQDPYPHNNW
jgi:hypothetical protein